MAVKKSELYSMLWEACNKLRGGVEPARYKDYVLVLGDMGELGEREAEYHKELGRYINKHSGLSKDAIILSVGKLSKNITNEITNCTAKHFDTIEQCISWIQDNINKNRTLFLKASRSMKFENIITGLD